MCADVSEAVETTAQKVYVKCPALSLSISWHNVLDHFSIEAPCLHIDEKLDMEIVGIEEADLPVCQLSGIGVCRERYRSGLL